MIAPVNISTLIPNAGQSTGSATSADPGQSFGTMLNQALNQAGDISNQADSMAASYAAGGPVSIDQLMVAEQQASLAVDLVVQVRDRVVSAYQSVMNMQV